MARGSRNVRRAHLPPTASSLTLGRTASDTSLSTDALTRLVALGRTTADTSVSTDALTRLVALGRSGSDTSVSTDTVTRLVALPRTAAVTSVSTDTATRAALAYARTAADTSTSTDAATRLVAVARSGASAAYAPSVLALGPRAYWRLDETSGTTITDQTGSHNGTLTGTPAGRNVTGALAAAGGDSDGALDLGNAASYVQTSYSPYVSGGKQTFLVWVNAHSGFGAASIIGGDGSGNAPTLWFDNTSQIGWWPDGNHEIAWPGTTFPGPGQWVMIAVAYDDAAISAE